MFKNIKGTALKAVPLKAIKKKLQNGQLSVKQAAEYINKRIPNLDFHSAREVPLDIYTGKKGGIIDTGINLVNCGKYKQPKTKQTIHKISSTLAFDPAERRQSKPGILKALFDFGDKPVGWGSSQKNALISFIDAILEPLKCRKYIIGSAWSPNTHEATHLALISPKRLTTKTHKEIGHKLFAPK